MYTIPPSKSTIDNLTGSCMNAIRSNSEEMAKITEYVKNHPGTTVENVIAEMSYKQAMAIINRK